MRGRDSRSLCGPGEGRGAYIVVDVQTHSLIPEQILVHKFRPVCPASMMRARSNASSAFLVPGPSYNVSSILVITSKVIQTPVCASSDFPHKRATRYFRRINMDVNKADYEPFCVKEILRSLESVDALTMMLSFSFRP